MKKSRLLLLLAACEISLLGCGPGANSDYKMQTTPPSPTSKISLAAPDDYGGPASDCYKGDDFACAVEVAIAQKTNAYRALQHLSALSYDSHSAFVARVWSGTQAQQGSISHDGFPEARNQSYKREFGAMGSVWFDAENVAMFGDDRSLSAEQVADTLTKLWWNSQGHRDNMLGRHSGIGVGLVKRGVYYYGTQIFYKLN